MKKVKVFFAVEAGQMQSQVQSWLNDEGQSIISAVTQSTGKNPSTGEDGIIVTVFYTPAK